MSFDFKARSFGKWILAGEHAVLRHKPAIVFPITSHWLEISYQDNKNPLTAAFQGLYAEKIHVLFWGILEYGFEYIQQPLHQARGHIDIKNHILIGSGMGASAAICVATSRWFAHQGWIDADEIADFARKLENLFHGQSSGLDIAGTITNCGVFFKRNHAPESLSIQWQPQWYLSHTHQTGMTSSCIETVQKLWEKQPKIAQRIDEQMETSVWLAREALALDQTCGQAKLAEAINLACLCFHQWGLTEGKVESHINHLLHHGALAAKPTGSGDGGYVLSLWDHPPPRWLPHDFIAL